MTGKIEHETQNEWEAWGCGGVNLPAAPLYAPRCRTFFFLGAHTTKILFVATQEPGPS